EPDVGYAEQQGREPLGADGEAPVWRHAVLEDVEVVRELRRVHAAFLELGHEDLGTVRALAARRYLHAAEDQVQAARQSALLRVRIERSSRLRELRDEHEVGAVLLQRPTADEPLA